MSKIHICTHGIISDHVCGNIMQCTCGMWDNSVSVLRMCAESVLYMVALEFECMEERSPLDLVL
jgi:hypothetical protein